MAFAHRSPDDWKRLGVRIRAERESQRLSRRELSEVTGVSETTIQSAEEGRVPKGRWPQSLTAIERALGWAQGSVEAILDGNEPRALPTGESAHPAESSSVAVPSTVYFDLVAIAAHVSAGRSAAFVQRLPYPDALARRTLGALDDAGLLPNIYPEADPTPTPPATEER
jgi:transcriptional regulator with XRE-family HTH domain